MTWTHQADVLLIALIARGAGMPALMRHLRHVSDGVSEEDIATRIAVMARTETMMRAALEIRSAAKAAEPG